MEGMQNANVSVNTRAESSYHAPGSHSSLRWFVPERRPDAEGGRRLVGRGKEGATPSAATAGLGCRHFRTSLVLPCGAAPARKRTPADSTQTFATSASGCVNPLQYRMSALSPFPRPASAVSNEASDLGSPAPYDDRGAGLTHCAGLFKLVRSVVEDDENSTPPDEQLGPPSSQAPLSIPPSRGPARQARARRRRRRRSV
jgi:hypothetical protein